MDIKNEYMHLTYDLAGSQTKNRFRQELLWGISVALDNLTNEDWNAVVFDYVCDIELHYNNRLELHQLKVNKSQKNFTLNSLTTSKNQNSIVGKLLIPLNESNICIKGIIVTNCFLKHNNKNIDCVNEFRLDNILKPTSKEYCALLNELKLSSLDCSKLYFLHTEMNLINPEYEIVGKLVKYYEKTFNCEHKNPNALYRLIRDQICNRACYEYRIDNYTDLIKEKGITKKELTSWIQIHKDVSNDLVKEVKEWINLNINNLKKRKIYNKKIPELLIAINTDKKLKELENKIVTYEHEHDDLLENDMFKVTKIIGEEFDKYFNIVYDCDFKMVFYVYVILKIVNGDKYE